MENFTFYLNFKNDATGLVEITEPVKFDGASFTVEQDKGRYGRDISYGNEEVSLEFYEGTFDNGLTMGLTQLLDCYKNYGFESEVEFILKQNGTTFTVGILDFQMAKTDLITFFECKVIQENNRAIIKRRNDINVDVFSDKDLDLNPITPLATENILLKAKPVAQTSNWVSNNVLTTGVSLYSVIKSDSLGAKIVANLDSGVNNCNVVKDYGIENTLSFIDNRYALGLGGFPNGGNSFTYIDVQQDFKDVSIKLSNLEAYSFATYSDPTNSLDGGGKVRLVIKYGYDITGGTDMTTIVLYERIFTLDYNPPISLPTEFDVSIPVIERGQRLFIYLECTNSCSDTVGILDAGINSVFQISAPFQSLDVSISGTSTGIDSVIKGVRYIDLFKQNIKSISGLTVDAPRFDIAGEFYEQFAFNGKLIRQYNNKPFYVNFKDLTEGLQEVNADFQINDNNVFLGKYDDFYTNNDLGGYLQAPDNEFISNFNERYTINSFDYAYKTFEENKDEANTVDGIHTKANFLLPNKLVENTKKIEVNHIRDPFAIESARRQGINTKESTSLDNDDKLFLIDVYPLPSGSMGGFGAKLLMRLNDGKLEILNNTLNGEGTPFNWTLLGFNLGSNFEILSGVNIGDYTVSEMTETNIKLTPIGFTPTIEGDHFIKVEYPLNNVNYVNRTNQGFTEIDNLSSGDNFSNLRYSIKRNMMHWSSYLKTASKYKPNGIIQNTFFKNNGLLSTKYGPETVATIEGANINVTDLSDAILSPMFYKTKVVASFETVKTLLDNLATQKGFIRIVDTNDAVVKIHPTKLDYEWVTNLLTIEGEKRNESDYITIDTVGTALLKINEVGYDIIILKNRWFKIDGFFVTLYDLNNVPLINRTRFDKFKVNGVTFTDVVTLSDALNGL
jgi:hypothetical protein